MTDPVRTLAERLQVAIDGWRLIHNTPIPVEELAREALAFVAERLMTREEVAELLYRASPQTGRWPTWEELDRATALRAEWFTMADALLRDLRERLGVKP